jgi:hypothetical protein
MTNETPKVAEPAVATLTSTIEGGNQPGDVTVRVTPTQVRRPWRATTRTVFQALVALAIMAPVLVQATGLDPTSLPWLAGVLAVCAAITRVMALPQVEAFLRRFLPFLSAAPRG